MRTAILGGGLSGLTIGYLLNGKNDFEILEESNQCGGLMRSFQESNFTFDRYGSHIIFSKDKTVLEFMLKILNQNKIRNHRNTKILYKNSYIKYPFENGLSDLTKAENFECIYSFIQNLLQQSRNSACKPASLKDWFYNTFGKGITEKYLIPYNEKIWKTSIDKIGTDWVTRIPNPPIEDIIKSSLGIETEGYPHQSTFYYPKHGGIQALTDSLLSFISNQVTNNFKIAKIEKEGKDWIISNGKSQKTFDKIISTIPLPELVAALDAPLKAKMAVQNLQYTSLICVMLGIDKPKVSTLSWLYIPEKTVIAHRVSFPSNYSTDNAPPNKSSILAEITCKQDDEIWKTSDEDILKNVISDLEKLGILPAKSVCFSKVQRTKYAYVVNDLEYSKNLMTVKTYLRNLGIDIIGRFAQFEYLNMDSCIRSAMDYVEKLVMN